MHRRRRLMASLLLGALAVTGCTASSGDAWAPTTFTGEGYADALSPGTLTLGQPHPDAAPAA